ncbi:MAG: ASCH domain-containing protein [Bacteroidales bacterium]|nr:ASCH domain-containing protein [Bacteroidales bacterium]
MEKIFSGEKKFEYRKRIPTDIRTIIVYATVPIKQIVAFIEVENVLQDTPMNIWKQTKEWSGLTYKFYKSYYKGKSVAYAIKFKNVYRLENPKSISIFKDVKSAPQSYVYIRESNKVLTEN